MRITTPLTSFFISIIFFSSLVQAQIPDEVIFFQNMHQDEYYTFKNPLSTKRHFPIRMSWQDILTECKGLTEGDHCKLTLYYLGKWQYFQFLVNLKTGDFEQLLFMTTRGGLYNKQTRELNYMENNKNIKSISFTATNGNYKNYPIATVNNTKYSLSYLFTDTPHPWGCMSSYSSPFLSGFIHAYSWVPGILYTNLSTLNLKLMIGEDCSGAYIGNIIPNCPQPIDTKNPSSYDLCNFGIENIPGSGYQLSYQNQILEINYAPPSLSVIPNQTITANKPFSLDLKNYLSKIVDGAPKVTMTATPSDVAGLHFDAENMTLSGRPSSTGSYQFTVNATSTLGEAAPITFMVHIGVNQDDKPEWKPMAELPGATVEVSYDFDMNRLLAHAAGIVEFKIAESFPHPEWLRIENGHLVGTPTANDAGTTQQVTLFAESPTGGSATNAQGDPEPLTLSIPIQQDGRLRPVIQSGDKTVGANEGIRFDLRNLVNDPTNDPNLQIVLDKVEPANEQLKLAINQSTVLEGLMPGDTPGQTFKLTLHAHNSQGGDSEPAVVNLKVETSPAYKPRFNTDNPVLPFLIPGTPLFHDFEGSHDVWPEGIPFSIEFAEGYSHPSWLTIKNNQLKAESVPLDIHRDIKFHVIIRNTPGGESQVIALNLYYMD